MKLPQPFSVDHTERRQDSAVTCPDCGAPMVLRETEKFLHKDGSKRKFYGCSKYPLCNSTHGAHPDGQPLGVPGNAATKKARIEAHEVFDDLWKSGKMRRKAAYYQLARAMGRDELHFGELSEEECHEAIRIIEEEF